MQRSMNAILVSSAYIRIVEYRVLSARSFMCIEKKKNPSVHCAKAEEGLQTTDFRLPTSYFRQFIKKKFLESEVRGLKNEV